MHLPPETRRLRFRPLVPADAAALADVFNDDYAKQFYGEMSLELAEKWVRKNEKRYLDDGSGLWALELLDTGEFIGDCGLAYQDVDSVRELEIGYHIHRDHRRKGFASEAAKACFEYGFANMDIERLISLVDKTNVASEGVASRLYNERSETVRANRPHWVYFTRREDWLKAQR